MSGIATGAASTPRSGGDALAADAAGNALFVGANGSPQVLRYSRYIPGVGWSALAPLPTVLGTTSSWLANVSVAGNGTALVVWTAFDGSRNHIYASELR